MLSESERGRERERERGEDRVLARESAHAREDARGSTVKEQVRAVGVLFE